MTASAEGFPIEEEPLKEWILKAYHEKYFAPNNLMLGITGDFDPKKVKKLLNKYFGDWQKKEIDFPKIPKVIEEPRPGVYQVYRDINQANIRFGHLGVNRDNPDRYAISVMNYILGGGGFNSRLMREIRSNRGLAYSVYSYYMGGQILPGMFVAGCETRNDAVLDTVQIMKSLMNEIREQPVSEDELRLAKESIINSFVFAFEDSHDIVERTLNLEMYDYPDDYLQSFREKIAAVTVADVQTAARKYLRPDELKIVLVGNSKEFVAPPSSLGLPLANESAH